MVDMFHTCSAVWLANELNTKEHAIAGLPRHRENGEFGSSFFQTRKTGNFKVLKIK